MLFTSFLPASLKMERGGGSGKKGSVMWRRAVAKEESEEGPFVLFFSREV